MDKKTWESRLAGNPRSPVFVRLAEVWLQEGDPEHASQLCLEGLKAHPGYATARILLARCLSALGREVESLVEYRKALREVPDTRSLLDEVTRLEGLEKTSSARVADRIHTLIPRPDPVPPPAPEPAIDDHPQPEIPSPHPQQKIVTATLAEIYASQGEYSEAIASYQRLIVMRPSEADRYRKRLTDLEELRRLQKEMQSAPKQAGKK